MQHPWTGAQTLQVFRVYSKGGSTLPGAHRLQGGLELRGGSVGPPVGVVPLPVVVPPTTPRDSAPPPSMPPSLEPPYSGLTLGLEIEGVNLDVVSSRM